MGFVCENTECFAPENKKGKEYPVAMDCPFCDEPLIQKNNFSKKEEELLSSLPYLIAYPLKRTLLETHQWTKLNLFKDTFLNYLKYLGLITASEFFNSEIKNRNMVSLFQNTLAEPSFGTWNLFIRETLNFLEEQEHVFFCKELPDYYKIIETGKNRRLYKGQIQIINSNGEVELKKQQATAIGMLINFRNRYLGHGLTIDEKESKLIWEEYSPIFFNLLDKMNFSTFYPMFKNEHGKTTKLISPNLLQIEHDNPIKSSVWIENNNNQLDILPFFVVPGELAISKESIEQLLTYESYTGKSIKYFSPEGTEKQTSGKTLERLNLLLKDKQIEQTYSPAEFTKKVFINQLQEYNNYTIETLRAEKKVIPGVYINRDKIESKLRDWVGARASIFFIAAEAGSGKTNLLVEKHKYYTEKGFNTLLVRTARMNKQSLSDEIKDILNIKRSAELNMYKSISGSQSKPTFVLIDGLNEAINSEDIWKEVLSIVKLFKEGSLKFVVTCRINSQADFKRYKLLPEDEKLIYRDESDGDSDIKSYAFWLTPLDMVETESAWNLYSKKDKSKFKPQFSFNDIANVDRSIYDQINNPLILRLFLEVYNSKTLQKKGEKHLNIWKKWLEKFNPDEVKFMMLLSNEIWEKGKNELLLEDLLNNPKIKEYIISDTLNSPYPKLKSLGWIGKFIKGLDVIITFTVEGLLIYLLGQILNQKKGEIKLSFINEVLNENNSLKTSAIEEFLSSQAIMGNIDTIIELIDEQNKGIDQVIKPMLSYVKIFGPEALKEDLMRKTTEGDWKALILLDGMMEKLALSKMRKTLAETFISHSNFKNKSEIEYGLKTISIIDLEFQNEIYSKIPENDILNTNDSNLIILLADYYEHISDLNKALNYNKIALEIKLNDFENDNLSIADSYENIGLLNKKIGEYENSIKYYNKH